MIDTSSPEGLRKRLYQIVDEYTKSRNFRALARIIGGSPRYDLQDLSDADAGNEPRQREE